MSESSESNTGALALVLVVVLVVLAVGGFLIWSSGPNDRAALDGDDNGVEIEGEINVDEVDEDVVEDPEPER